MELQVLVSKKGTKVVTATQLHQVLELPKHHYAVTVKKWLNDVYEFQDGIRKPLRMQDYASRKVKDNPILDDYYLSVELAKMITLRSKSRAKLKYALQLSTAEDREGQASGLNKAQFLHLIELTKAMSLVSCQEASEREHLRTYKERNGGQAANWWTYRAEVLGYTAEELREKIRRRGQSTKGKSQRQLLAAVDKFELIRAGIVDLFMSIGKTVEYARHMGDLAKTLASEMNIDIYDDREGQLLFAPPVKAEAVEELQALLLEAA